MEKVCCICEVVKVVVEEEEELEEEEEEEEGLFAMVIALIPTYE